MQQGTRYDQFGTTLTSALALSAAIGMGTASAQPSTFRVMCTTHGANAIEPVGDRDGHGLQVAEAVCINQGGPFDGAVTTQHTIWEFDRGIGTMLSSHGVTRKPGLMTVYVNAGGSLTLQMTEGKVTGWTSSGKGRYPVATGSATALAGKTYGWTARPTGPRTYVIDVVLE